MILYTWPDTHGEVSLPKGGRLTKITASAFATVSNLTAPFLIRQRKFLFLLASVYSYTADVFYSILLPSALRLSSITVRLHPFHRSVVHYLLSFPNQRHGQAPHGWKYLRTTREVQLPYQLTAQSLPLPSEWYHSPSHSRISPLQCA